MTKRDNDNRVITLADSEPQLTIQPEYGPVVTMKTLEKTEFDQAMEESSHEDEIMSTQMRASIQMPNVTEYEANQRSDCFK